MKYLLILLVASCAISEVIFTNPNATTHVTVSSGIRYAIPIATTTSCYLDTLTVRYDGEPPSPEGTTLKWYVAILVGDDINSATEWLPWQQVEVSVVTISNSSYVHYFYPDGTWIAPNQTYWLAFQYIKMGHSWYIRYNDTYYEEGYKYSGSGPWTIYKKYCFWLRGESDVSLTRNSWGAIKATY